MLNFIYLSILFLIAFSSAAHAYIGPGLGLGVIGMVLGGVLFFFLLLVSFLWYPIKRLLRQWNKSKKEHGEAETKVSTSKAWVYRLLNVATGALIVVVIIGLYQFFADDSNKKLATKEIALQSKPINHIAEFPARFETTPVEHAPFEDSYLLVTSMFDDKNAMRLIDHQGNVVHEWVFDKSRLLKGRNNFKIDLHGSDILSDGSVVANFEHFAISRVDVCNRAMFRIPDTSNSSATMEAHHSVFVTSRGTIWFSGRRLPSKELQSKYPAFDPRLKNEALLEISADGKKIIRNLDLFTLFMKNNLYSFVTEIGASPQYRVVEFDNFHLNDVEELSVDMAAAFPQFEAGDLLLSLRNMSMLLVVDPDTGKIKWRYKGELLYQHDGDFQPDGSITVFDNRYGKKGAAVWGGSRIVKIDPKTNTLRTLYESPNFYSNIRGKHSVLEDGSILITEFSTGRVFIVNPSGKVTYEYVNPRRVEDSGKLEYYEITKAQLVKKDFFTQPLECRSP